MDNRKQSWTLILDNWKSETVDLLCSGSLHEDNMPVHMALSLLRVGLCFACILNKKDTKQKFSGFGDVSATGTNVPQGHGPSFLAYGFSFRVHYRPTFHSNFYPSSYSTSHLTSLGRDALAAQLTVSFVMCSVLQACHLFMSLSAGMCLHFQKKEEWSSRVWFRVSFRN